MLTNLDNVANVSRQMLMFPVPANINIINASLLGA